MNEFINRARKLIVSLRFSIISIFIVFFIATIFILMAFSYWRMSSTILFTANKLMYEVSLKVITEIDREMMQVDEEAEFIAQMIQKKIFDIDNLDFMVPFLYELIKQYPIVQTAFWGDEKGNFFIIEKENGNLMLRIISPGKVPANTTIIYQNEYKKNILKQINSMDTSYDPRNRIWYQQAKAAGHAIWTDVYRYKSNNLLGMTAAAPVYNSDKSLRGVFAFDIRLDYLSNFISKKTVAENGIVYLAAKAGEIIAFPGLDSFKLTDQFINIHSIHIPWVIESFDLYNKSNKSEFSFEFNNLTYLAIYNYIPHFKNFGWLVGIVVPESDFTYELRKAILFDVLVGLIILVLGIIAVSGLVAQVVRPIRRAVNQLDKIKHFDLREEKMIYSRIKEVILLSEAIQALRSGLQSFRKYVPATLVRHLIEEGEGALVGGTKKTLAIFFSDIEHFTALAETLEPNLLMELMCEYFEELSNIIISEKGTIDKYIGDSIMAFWGAPTHVNLPVQHAANAALKCLRRIQELNKKWHKEGKPHLETRIGLHFGHAIVGNLGSTERLNYTALGDDINIANRLEGTNKIYHTHILVSETVHQVIKNKFILRKVDKVSVRGKMAVSDIYELLAENKNELHFDIDAYRDCFEKAFVAYQNARWDEAIVLFNQCLKVYPEDKLSLVFIERCEQFKLHPPVDWDGVWRMM